jgi:cell wall-associated NlpC family hydrolase
MLTERTHPTSPRTLHRAAQRAATLPLAGGLLLAALSVLPAGVASAAPTDAGVVPAIVPAIVTGVPDADQWSGSDEAQRAFEQQQADREAALAALAADADRRADEFLATLDLLEQQAVLERVAPVLDEARAKLGRPYSYGASGPNAFDCSGFTRWVWQRAGVELAHYSGAQWAQARHIAAEELRPGDLVFYWGRGGGDPSHVGLYVGDGQIIHAPGRGRSVRYDSVWYWPGATVAAGRVG